MRERRLPRKKPPKKYYKKLNVLLNLLSVALGKGGLKLMRPFNYQKATSRFVTLEIDEESVRFAHQRLRLMVKQRVKEAFTERFGEDSSRKYLLESTLQVTE